MKDQRVMSPPSNTGLTFKNIFVSTQPQIPYQITVTAKFVQLNSKTKTVDVRENFLTFISIMDSTGQGLANTVTNLVTTYDFNINDFRGQGKDNGTNIKGRHSVLQKKILI